MPERYDSAGQHHRTNHHRLSREGEERRDVLSVDVGDSGRPSLNDLGIAPCGADAIHQLVDRLLWGQRTVMDSARHDHGGIRCR